MLKLTLNFYNLEGVISTRIFMFDNREDLNEFISGDTFTYEEGDDTIIIARNRLVGMRIQTV